MISAVESRHEVINLQHEAFDEDPMSRLAAQAEEQVLRMGLTGASNGDMDPSMLHLATSAWMIRNIRQTLRESREELVNELRGDPPTPSGKMEALKRQGPAAGVGAGIIAGLTWFRDFFMSGT